MKKFRTKMHWWLGFLGVFCLFHSLVGHAEVSLPDLSGKAWDESVFTHPKEVKAFSEQQKLADFSVQTIPMNQGLPQVAQTRMSSQPTRYTVLAIDISISMAGKPLEVAKEAASKFVEQVIQSKSTNYVAVVAFHGSSTVACGFTNHEHQLKNAIHQLYVDGGTNVTQALKVSEQLFQQVKQPNMLKNIVMLSDGEPDNGTRALKMADQLKQEGHLIYSLGFFHQLFGSSLDRARTFMDRLQNAGYYDVTSADQLEFEFDKIADDIVNRSNIFKYPSSDPSMQGSDASAVYYYKDSYFMKNAYKYNEELATMSLSLALSAFGSNDVGTDYQNKSNNAKNLLKELGFKDVKTNAWFTQKPEKDSIGVIAAHKSIHENNQAYTLIALAVRGGGYESEWSSNVTLGKDGHHQGFRTARDHVLRFLREEYIQAHQIKGPVKLWITGFSRAAATANLVAGRLDEEPTLPGCTLKRENLYAYTFETPAGVHKKEGIDSTKGPYKNIFNIVNETDIVPRVAPEEWDFARYGQDEVLPSKEDSSEKIYPSSVEKMKSRFASLAPATKYLVDDFAMTKIDWLELLPGDDPFIYTASQGVFLTDFVKILANEGFKNRATYYEDYEMILREVLASENGAMDKSGEWLAIQKFHLLLLRDYWSSLKALTNPQYLEHWIRNISLEAEIPIKEKNVRPFTRFFGLLIKHPIVMHAAITQTEHLKQAHFPELCLAWLQSQDPNYIKGGTASFVSGNYRIIRINCPVDVEVYNDEQQVVAAFVDDQPQAHTSLVTTVNEQGEKLLYLPPDANYTVKTTGTATGKMTYTINEYSYDARAVTRISTYTDLPVVAGKTYVGQVPAYTPTDLENSTENGTKTAYALLDETTQTVVAPAQELRGKEATKAIYTLTVTSENDEQGAVFGGGSYQAGSFVQLTALPTAGHRFIGWYQGTRQVSTEATYRFPAKEEQTFVAKFQSKTTQSSADYNQAHGQFDPEKHVVKANNWATFFAAYCNEQVTKIVLTQNIVDTTPNGLQGPTAYKRKKSLEIDGQGHRLTLKQFHSLRVSETPDTYTETVNGQNVWRSMFHMHDLSIQQNLEDAVMPSSYCSFFVGMEVQYNNWQKVGSPVADNLATNWYFRFGNIDTKQDDNTSNAKGVQRFATVANAEVTVYGKMDLSTTSENMYVGSLIVEDGTRWSGITERGQSSVVWFIAEKQRGATGANEEVTLGAKSHVTLNNRGNGQNYPAIYGYYREVTVNKQATLAINMHDLAWGFEQDGSSLRIKDGATVNLTSRSSSTAVQFGRSDPFNFSPLKNCHLLVEPGGSLFVTGETQGNNGLSLIDFTGSATGNAKNQTEHCTIELDHPKAYDFKNSSPNTRSNAHRALNLRNDTNTFVVHEAEVAVWTLDHSLQEIEHKPADQTLPFVRHFELFGENGKKHTKDILTAPAYKAIPINEFRRIKGTGVKK